MCIFPYVKVGEDAHHLARRGKFVVARTRNNNFVADAANIDNRLSRLRTDEFAVEKRDHLNQRFINPASKQA